MLFGEFSLPGADKYHPNRLNRSASPAYMNTSVWRLCANCVGPESIA